MVGLQMSDGLDVEKFKNFYEDQIFRKTHGLEVQTKSF
jgi:hypothetical protein